MAYKTWSLAALLGATLGLVGCDKPPLDIRTIDDAAHAKIGVMTGTTGETIVHQRFPQADIQTFQDVMDAVASLNAGKLDAVVTSFPTAIQVAKKNLHLQVLPQPLKLDDTSVAVRKGETILLAQIDQIITQFQQDGTLQSADHRWFKPDLAPYEEIEISVPTTGIPLRIGVSATREPLNFVDAKGRITGHEADIARLLAVKLARPIEFHDMPFMALLPALQSGKIDAIITGMTATAERRKKVDFSVSYFQNPMVMLTRKPNAGNPTATATKTPPQGKMTTGADLNGRKIAVLLGSAHETYATKTYPDATILQFQNIADVILAVKTGKADAGLNDADPLRELLKTDPTLSAIGDDLFAFPVAAAFSKNQHALREQFNQFLAASRQSGLYDNMFKRWLRDGSQKKHPVSAPNTQGVITIGVAVVGQPFIFVQDNELAGFDIEMAERFAAAQGKKPVFLNMEFSALIAAVASGKVDFVIASIFVTDERKKQVDFADPYYQMGTKAFGLAKNVAVASPAPASPAAATSPIAAASLKIRSGADLDGLRLAVLQGSAQEAFATKTYPKATILRFTSGSDTTVAVKTGKADAALGDETGLIEILRDDPSLGILQEPLFAFPVGAGFNKASRPLTEQFNAFLAQLQTDGTLADIFTRWTKNREWTMPDIPNRKDHEILRVGIAGDGGVPFEFFQDNELVGLDVEIVKRFGASQGREVQFLNMDFGALIAAVSSNKVDMIISGIFVTPERLLRIDFSDPYDHVAAKAYALKSNLAAYDVVASDVAANAPTPVQSTPGFLDRLAESFQSNIVHEKRYLLILSGLQTTVVISILSTVFGTLLGALVCFMRMSPKTALNMPAGIYIAIMRGTPVLVLLMLIFYVVFGSVNISPVLVAVVAFGMNFAAYVAEIFRTGIQGVDRGQSEAGIAMGFSRVSTFMHIVLPQTVQRILPVYKGEFLSLVKMTSIVGYIAVEDLTKASDIIRSRTFDAFFPLVMVAVLYFVISWVLMQALEYLERITDPKYKRRTGGAS